jgi:hypothetical protein
MKIQFLARIITIALYLSIVGCTKPCELYLRNFTNYSVKLQGKINNRRDHYKLPNSVYFYKTPITDKQMHGEWQSTELITWIDSINFFINIPAQSVIDLKDVSRGLVLGAVSPGVFITISYPAHLDTLMTGDYRSLKDKFRSQSSFLSDPIFYYDVQ